MDFEPGSILARVTDSDVDQRVQGGYEPNTLSTNYGSPYSGYNDPIDGEYYDPEYSGPYDNSGYSGRDDLDYEQDINSYDPIVAIDSGYGFKPIDQRVPSTYQRPLNAFSGRYNYGGDVAATSGIAKDYNMVNVVLIALIIVLIVAFAYYVWNKKHAVKKNNQAHPHIPAHPKNPPKPAHHGGNPPRPAHGGETGHPTHGHNTNAPKPKNFVGDIDATCNQRHYKKTTLSDTSA
jgi:hypothetical protein